MHAGARPMAVGVPADDQVLNIPGWGRPSEITRTGRHRGWREVWIYDRGYHVRELSFVNGTLTDIDASAPARLASVVER
jgi:hypothetical protein